MCCHTRDDNMPVGRYAALYDWRQLSRSCSYNHHQPYNDTVAVARSLTAIDTQ